MARVLITGSSDGLGLMAGQLLVRDGHSVTYSEMASASDALPTSSLQAKGLRPCSPSNPCCPTCR